MKHLLANLSDRDRWALLIGGLVLIVFFFYEFIYTPLNTAVEMQATQLKEKKETVAWLQTIHQNSKSKSAPKPINKARLLSLIGTEVRSADFQKFKAQVEQTGLGEIQVTFDRVPYNQIITWLLRINNAYALDIKQVNIDKSDTPGVVKFMLVIAANG